MAGVQYGRPDDATMLGMHTMRSMVRTPKYSSRRDAAAHNSDSRSPLGYLSGRRNYILSSLDHAPSTPPRGPPSLMPMTGAQQQHAAQTDRRAARRSSRRDRHGAVNFTKKNIHVLQPLESTLARNRAHEAMVLGLSSDGTDGLYEVPHTARGTVLPLIGASRADHHAHARALQASLSATLAAQAAAQEAAAAEQSLSYLDQLATAVNLEDAFADHQVFFPQAEPEDDGGRFNLRVDTTDADEQGEYEPDGSPKNRSPKNSRPMHGIFKWQRGKQARYVDEGPGTLVAGTWMHSQLAEAEGAEKKGVQAVRQDDDSAVPGSKEKDPADFTESGVEILLDLSDAEVLRLGGKDAVAAMSAADLAETLDLDEDDILVETSC